MQRSFKRALSLLSVLALVVSLASVAAVVASAEDVEYAYKLDPRQFVSIGATQSDAEVTMYGDQGEVVGQLFHNAAGGTVSGYAIYRTDDSPFKDVCFETRGTPEDSWWAGQSKFYGSSDGVNWTLLSTVTNATDPHGGWGGVYNSIYDSVSFAEDEQIRYVKVELNVSAFGLLPSLKSIRYNKYEEGVTYNHRMKPKEADIACANGDLYTGFNEGLSEFYAFRDKDGANMGDANMVEGTLTFTSPKGGIITDFHTVLFALNTNVLGSHEVSVSSDGVHFTKITPNVARTAAGSPDEKNMGGWGCATYDVKAHFNADKNVRYIRVALKPTSWTVSPSMKYFEINAQDTFEEPAVVLDGAVALTNPPAPSFVVGGDVKNITSAGGYGLLLTGENPAVAATGYIQYHFDQPLKDYRITVYCGGNAYYCGSITIAISADGEKWEKLPAVVTGAQDRADWDLWKYTFEGAVDPNRCYQYIRFNVVRPVGGEPFENWCPGIASMAYTTAAADTGAIVDSAMSYDTITAEQITLIETAAANDSTLTAEQKDWLHDAKLLANYLKANPDVESVAVSDLQPVNAGTAMTTLDQAEQKFSYHVDQALLGQILAANTVTDVKYGVLYVGRSATRDQLLTLAGKEGYFAEEAVDSAADLGAYTFDLTRVTTNIGRRDTVLPYVCYTDADGEHVIYADDVISYSPIGYLKKLTKQNASDAAFQERLAAAAEAIKADYADIADVAQTVLDIANTADQTAALALLPEARQTQDEYYKLMMAIYGGIYQ